MWLYNSFDRELMHFRRYNRSSLRALLNKSRLKVTKSFYFYSVGTVGWYFSGKVQKNNQIPNGQMRTYNKLVPLFRTIDNLSMRKVGLSVVGIGQK